MSRCHRIFFITLSVVALSLCGGCGLFRSGEKTSPKTEAGAEHKGTQVIEKPIKVTPPSQLEKKPLKERVAEKLPILFPQPSPTPPDKPLQYFFPHGHQGKMLLWRDYIIRSASWTRGDGIAFFRVGKNGSARTPEYVFGVISAGYVTDMCIVGNVLYVTTNYSVQTIVLPEDGKKPYLLENMFLSFPNGGVDKIAFVNGKIYITANHEIREYDITRSGRLCFSRVFLHDAKNVAVLRGYGDTLYLARKPIDGSSPWTVEIQNLKNGTGNKIKVPVFVNNILMTKNGVFLVSGRRLLDLAGKEVVFPGDGKVLSYTQLQNGAIGVTSELKNKNCKFAMFDGKSVTDVSCGSVKSDYRFLCDGTYFGVWTGNYLKCNNLADVEKDGLLAIPVIYTEAPVIFLPPCSFSIDCSGGEYRLYGFDASHIKSLGAPFDVDVTWRKQEGRNFRYDIVLPPFDLQVYGKWLFAPEAILDVGNPKRPEVVARYTGTASCIRFDGTRQLAFFAQDTKLSVKSIANLPKMTDVAEIPADKEGVPQWTSFDISGNLLFANTREKVVTYDISDVKKPVKISALPLKGGTFYQILVYGKYLYAFPYSNDKALPGVLVADYSDPKSPKIVYEMTEYRGCYIVGAKVYKDKLYIANGNYVRRYSLGQPDKPVLEKSWTGPDRAKQSYLYMDVQNGVIVGKKYPRMDVWRIDE